VEGIARAGVGLFGDEEVAEVLGVHRAYYMHIVVHVVDVVGEDES
jgi:hypothetical protein